MSRRDPTVDSGVRSRRSRRRRSGLTAAEISWSEQTLPNSRVPETRFSGHVKSRTLRVGRGDQVRARRFPAPSGGSSLNQWSNATKAVALALVFACVVAIVATALVLAYE